MSRIIEELTILLGTIPEEPIDMEELERDETILKGYEVMLIGGSVYLVAAHSEEEAGDRFREFLPELPPIDREAVKVPMGAYIGMLGVFDGEFEGWEEIVLYSVDGKRWLNTHNRWPYCNAKYDWREDYGTGTQENFLKRMGNRGISNQE
jgi:hypothetical protein